jgi:hypothetical protein
MEIMEWFPSAADERKCKAILSDHIPKKSAKRVRFSDDVDSKTSIVSDENFPAEDNNLDSSPELCFGKFNWKKKCPPKSPGKVLKYKKRGEDFEISLLKIAKKMFISADDECDIESSSPMSSSSPNSES